MAPPFEDIVIVDLDVQKTTWSRVHSAMRTLYLRLNRDPDIAWNKFFFEERNARVEVKRHGLWIEDGYIVFDCLLIDVDAHHLPDIRRSIAYANERSRELRESQREEREQLKAKARDEAEVLKSLRANIREEREQIFSGPAGEPPALFEPEPVPEPATTQSLEDAAHAQLQTAQPEPAAQTPAENPVPDYEQRLRDFYAAMAPKIAPAEPWPAAKPAQPSASEPTAERVAQPAVEATTEQAAQPAVEATREQAAPPAAEAAAEPPAPEPSEASELDLESKRKDWRARFRAAYPRNDK